MAAGCVDWIDLVPRPLQFLPARLQEWSFGRTAARIIRSRFQGARVLARDLEVAVHLVGRPGVALEVHRVPGGRIRRGWLRRCVGAGMPVVAISGGVREDLEALGVPADRMTVEHDAHDPALVDALPERAAARESLGIHPDAGVVLYAGGLLRWKGVDVLVDAARQDLLDGASVLIVGGMEADIAALRKRASGLASVRILGHRPAHEIPLFLAAADVGVVPNRRTPRISSHHTSPLKVFEAMAAGLPMVVSDLPSLRDVLRPDEAVFVEPESPSALGRGIAGLFADADQRRNIAARAREAVQANTWGARARRILTFMEQHA
jgi:glycosyltransferase involved in cell wall biosynthesis